MYAQLSSQYRKIGQNLYRKQGDAFIHCAVVPSRFKGLAQAVKWFESLED